MTEPDMNPYSRGYRVGTRRVLDIDPPPPGPDSPDRAEYRRGFHEGRREELEETTFLCGCIGVRPTPRGTVWTIAVPCEKHESGH